MINPIPKLQNQPKKAPPKKKEEPINSTLQGVLLNTRIRSGGNSGGFIDFDDTCDTLMISQNTVQTQKKPDEGQEPQGFNIKKALLPLAIGTVAAFAGLAALSSVL